MKDEKFTTLFKAEDFAGASLKEFTEKSPKEVNPKKVMINQILSFLFNLISVVLGSSLLYYYLGDQPFGIMVFFGWVLGIIILVLIEISKRYTFGHMGGKYAAYKRLALGGLVLSLFLVGTSISISFKGGLHLPDLFSPTPPRAVNPEIDSLSRQLAEIDLQIAEHKENKTKGQIRWNSEVAITDLTKQRGPINDRLMMLKGKDDVGHEEDIKEHKDKNRERGFILAILAICCDVILLLLVFRNKSLMYEVARIVANERNLVIAGMDPATGKKVNPPQKKTQPTPQKPDPSSSGTDPQNTGKGGTGTATDPQNTASSKNGVDPILNHKKQAGFFFRTNGGSKKRKGTQMKGTQSPDPQSVTPTPQATDPVNPSVLHTKKEGTLAVDGTQGKEDPKGGTFDLDEAIRELGVSTASETMEVKKKMIMASEDYLKHKDLKPGAIRKRITQYQKRLQTQKDKAGEQSKVGKVSAATQRAIHNNQRWLEIYTLLLQESENKKS